MCVCVSTSLSFYIYIYIYICIRVRRTVRVNSTTGCRCWSTRIVHPEADYRPHCFVLCISHSACGRCSFGGLVVRVCVPVSGVFSLSVCPVCV